MEVELVVVSAAGALKEAAGRTQMLNEVTAGVIAGDPLAIVALIENVAPVEDGVKIPALYRMPAVEVAGETKTRSPCKAAIVVAVVVDWGEEDDTAGNVKLAVEVVTSPPKGERNDVKSVSKLASVL